jgi:hypothetical protein
VGRVDRDAALALFGGGIDVRVALLFSKTLVSEGVGDGCGESGFAVVDVTDGADVDVRVLTKDALYP